MCGLTGYWQPAGFADAAGQQQVRSMAERLVHRGPDDAGHWIDGAIGVALGHRRLSIVDLSPAGHQPMVSPSGRYVIAFNGEIYNHLELRTMLERGGHAPPEWRGHSDTESLLAAFDAIGPEAALQASIGMFAFALWDRLERRLTLARDRIGEKPMYYGWQGRGHARALLFGSELKALRAHPSFDAAIDRESLVLFMRTGYVPAPRSIHADIFKVLPGTLLTFGADGAPPATTRYWDAAKLMLDGHAAAVEGDPAQAVDELERLLLDAVGRQMVADVPLGAFLSGGIDSSTIVALMQAQSSRPVRSFSIGFHEAGYDEAVHAKAVARYLGTDHTELYVTSTQALDVVPKLPTMFDEPFADSSQIPTHLVSQLARRDVAVALSGDAGDELFGGYTRYAITQRAWGRMQAIPAPLRQLASGALLALPARAWTGLHSMARKASARVPAYTRFGEKVHKGARAMRADNADALYLHTVSQWSDPALVVPGTAEPKSLLTGAASPLAALPDVARMMAYDTLTYLPDDILVKVDRAAMAVSLETRVPFLDHRVVEHAWRMPMSLKLRDGVGKWALREVLFRHVPRALVERPKMGFGVPIDHWLRGPLREWAESLLDANRLRAEGYLAAEPIRATWQAHLDRTDDQQYGLWNVLTFQAWLEQQAAGPN